MLSSIRSNGLITGLSCDVISGSVVGSAVAVDVDSEVFLMISLRRGGVADAPALVELWRLCGLHVREHEVADELASVAGRDPELILVCVDHDMIVASVFGAYDGRRGWVNRLATAPAYRGLGLASQLLDRLEDELRIKGCSKLNMLVRADNSVVLDFYRARGYCTDDAVFLGKRIIE